MNKTEHTRPWYREPLMWLVLGLPATVVVAGLATLAIAVQNPETLVSAPHKKVGFTVEKVDAAPRGESNLKGGLPNASDLPASAK